ncbi:hypothetical protein RUM43_000298 [Polyplax serrata]|uniref:Uncharacterized protein n=1 Tax=Polyplax serrata TaxID=468196 RepID=A0AAN8XMX9_POLSC
MEPIFFASASRKKISETQENVAGKTLSPNIWDEIPSMRRIIVMSGSAQRKSLQSAFLTRTPLDEVLNNCRTSYQAPYKTSYIQEFSKLRAPYRTPRYRKPKSLDQMSATKSCKILFDYLKPYRRIDMGDETSVSGRHDETCNSGKFSMLPQAKKRILKNLSTFKFLRVREENQESVSHSAGFNFLTSFECDAEEQQFNFLNYTFTKKKENTVTDIQMKMFSSDFHQFEDQRTTSSEDFLKNVFPTSGIDHDKIQSP